MMMKKLIEAKKIDMFIWSRSKTRLILYFTLNLNDSKYSIDRINFLDKNNQIIQSKNVDNFVEDSYEKRFIYSNSVLLKNFMKEVLNTYLDEG